MRNLVQGAARTIKAMTWVPADDALLGAFGTGDPEAATAFIRRYQARVYGLAQSIVIDPTLAEDVAQEAFTRAWRHAATFDARRGTVPTWLLTITRNLAIDALRLRRAVPVDPATLAALDLRATGIGADPGRAAELADHTTRLRVALAALPSAQRRALVLAGLCGRTAQEVSESEGIPLGTAKTRIRTAMRRLRHALADEGLNDEGLNDEGLTDRAQSEGGLTDQDRSDGGLTDGGLTNGGRTAQARSDGGRTDQARSDGGRTDQARSDGGLTDQAQSDGRVDRRDRSRRS